MPRPVSSDQRPATSRANTTSLARALGWTNSGWVLSLRLLARARADGVETPVWCPRQTALRQTGAGHQQRSPADGHHVWCDVQVTHHDVGGDPPTCFCAHAGTALSGANPRLPSSPVLEHAARWWPKASTGRPHLQEAGGQRQAETKAALEQVTLNPIVTIGRCSGESHQRTKATLRSEQGPLGGSHGSHDPQAEIPLARN